MALTFVLAVAEASQAQGLGYGVVGPAGVSGFFSSGPGVHVAGGGEVLARGVAGVGAEFGVLANTSSALTVFSMNGVVHLIPSPPQRGVSPFVTGGYSRLSSGEGSFTGWNVGVGVDLWRRQHLGIRVDVRDHVRPDSRGTVHYWTFRAGIAFKSR